MAASNITIGGVQVFVPQFTRRKVPYGSLNIAANGSRTYTQRGVKSEFELSWDESTLVEKNKALTVFDSAVAVTLVDEDGASYSVHRDDQPLEYSVEQGATRLYTFALKLFER